MGVCRKKKRVWEIDMTMLAQIPEQKKFYQYALWLAFFTIFYNTLEGLVSIYLGVQDEALTLFGFGIDSFIEVFQGLVSWQWSCAFVKTLTHHEVNSNGRPCVSQAGVFICWQAAC
jgi:hypothetical protein